MNYNIIVTPKEKFNFVLKILITGFIFCFLFYYFKSLLIRPYSPILESPFHPPVNAFCDYYAFNDSFWRKGFVLQHGGYLPGAFLFLQILGAISLYDPYIGIKFFLFGISTLFFIYIYKEFINWELSDRFLIFITFTFLNLPMLFMFHTGNFEGISFILILYSIYFFQKAQVLGLDFKANINLRWLLSLLIISCMVFTFVKFNKDYHSNKYVGKKIAKNIKKTDLETSFISNLESIRFLKKNDLENLKPSNITSDDIVKYDIKILVIKDSNLFNLKKYISNNIYNTESKYLGFFKYGWSYYDIDSKGKNYSIVYINNLQPITNLLIFLSSFFVLLLLLNFRFKDSLRIKFNFKPKVRLLNVSVFLIALATSIKIFPVLFLLLLINKENYKEIFFKFPIFLSLCVLIPFLLAGDVINNINLYVNSYGHAVNIYKEHMVTGLSSLHVGNHSLFNFYHLLTYPNSSLANEYEIGKYFLLGLLIFSSLAIFKVKSEILKLSLIISSFCLFFPTSSEYRLIYMIIPLLLIIKKPNYNEHQKFLLILISLLLIPKTYIYFYSSQWINSGTFFNPILLMIIYFYCLKYRKVDV